MNYDIVTDACSNLTDSDRVTGLTIIPFPFFMNGQEYISDPSLSAEEKRAHYARLRDKQVAKTTQINVTAFTEVFESLAEAGKGAIYIGLSAGISGTFRQAQIAAEEMNEKYPDLHFLTVNSKNAGFAEAILVCEALRNREDGMSIEDNAAALEKTVPHVRGVIMADDLSHLRRTGRVPAIIALAGTMLGIKPLLKGNDEGKISMAGKARGTRAALDQLAKELNEHILPQKQDVYISHCDAESDAAYLAEKIKENPYIGSIRIEWHEVMSGCHLGPGAISLFYLADQR